MNRSVYDLLGGEQPFHALVDAFYDKVYADPVLRPMFPDDMATSKRRQFLFLLQYFGGPNTYSQERGHPRLRMRHFPFDIDQRTRDRWLLHMLDAIDEAGIRGEARDRMREYFERASAFLINRAADIEQVD